MAALFAHRLQLSAIVASAVLLGSIVELVRKHRLQEAYALLWLSFGVVFVVFSVWRSGLELFAHLLGIAYAPAALFLLLLIAIFLILIQFSIVVSRLSESNRALAQELALLREELRRATRASNDAAP